ncbi:MAG: VCBS repeat-containing protein, partial [Verrucomicrobiota bacterium]
MIEALDKVEMNTMRTNWFLGTFEVEQARKAWASLPALASPQDRFAASVRLGVAELNQGREAEAIALLETALHLVINDDGRANFRISQLGEAARHLSIAALRLGEVENCCARPNPDSCLLPLSSRAEHTHRRGSENAVEYLTQTLASLELGEADRGRAIWLLNIAHMTLGSHPEGVPEPWRVIFDEEQINPYSTPPFPAFTNIAEEAGVNTMSHAGGCIADDLDGDGWPDLLVSSWDPAVPMVFFRNTGEGTFERREAGLSKIRGGLNLKQADYDNDGDLDVFVMRGAWLEKSGYHPNSLLQNDGNANFLDVTYAVGLAEPSFPTQTAEWLDFDLDGDLDLFVGNESNSNRIARCHLFRNDEGRFTEVGREAGVDVVGFVKGVTSGDFDGDRYPDLFLSGLTGENLLLRNRGDGTFADARDLIDGPILPVRSFPTWFFDFDNDGWLDIFVASYDFIGLEYVNYYRGLEMSDRRI